MQLFVQLVLQCFGDNVARQDAGHIATLPWGQNRLAEQVSKAVAKSRTKFYFRANLPGNDFASRKVSYTMEYLVHQSMTHQKGFTSSSYA